MAVNGRGCLNGPGPVPTPVLSPCSPGPDIIVVGKLPWDDDINGWAELITVDWLDGKILRAGDVRGGTGGGICCEVLREEGIEVTRGDEIGRGDGGTELRSGAMILCFQPI